MSSALDPQSGLRAAALRAALHSYPAPVRSDRGPEILDIALELASAGHSTAYEVRGIVRGGISERAHQFRRGLGAFDRRSAGSTLVAPLASLVAAVWGPAAIARIAGRTGGAPGLTLGSAVLLLSLTVLLVAVARRQRGFAAGAASVIFVQATLSAGWSEWRGDVVTAAPALHLHVGPWWFGPSMVWSMLPFVAMLIAASLALRPAAPRVPGMRRPLRESATIRLGVMLLPAAIAMLAVEYWPTLILEPNGAETTELPGLLLLILIVGSFWLSTASLKGRDDLCAAAALFGLAAIPAVAYGFSHLLTPHVTGLATSQPMRLAIVLGLAGWMMAAAVGVFAAALARVGLRSLPSSR